jgi:hypothetical protein
MSTCGTACAAGDLEARRSGVVAHKYMCRKFKMNQSK